MEDYPDTRDTLAYVLAHLGHRVETAPDAGTALERLNREGFDVLLTDVWMPRADGRNLLQELRVRGKLPPYVVSMSTMHLDDARGPSQVAGCYAHLVQPFKLKELEELLGRVAAADA